jgi:hypothetical protein
MKGSQAPMLIALRRCDVVFAALDLNQQRIGVGAHSAELILLVQLDEAAQLEVKPSWRNPTPRAHWRASPRTRKRVAIGKRLQRNEGTTGFGARQPRTGHGSNSGNLNFWISTCMPQ